MRWRRSQIIIAFIFLIVSIEFVQELKDNYFGRAVIFTAQSRFKTLVEHLWLREITSINVFLPSTSLSVFYALPFKRHPPSPFIFSSFPWSFSPLSLLLLCFVPPRTHPPSSLQVSVWTYCWRSVVVLHAYHHFLLHGQSGCLPHCGADGLTHWKCRGLGQTDRDSIWDAGLWLYKGVFQGMDTKDILQTYFSQYEGEILFISPWVHRLHVEET